jgi:hypothetical protein
MRNLNEDTITQAVLASVAGCRNERLRTVITSLAQHLHSRARNEADRSRMAGRNRFSDGADWVSHPPGTAPDVSSVDVPYHTLDCDFILNPARIGK